MTTFTADLSRNIHGHVMTVSGELDIHSGMQVRAATKTATKQWTLPHSRLVIDLANLTFIDGAGLGVLMDSRDAVMASAREFQLSHASARMRRLMTMTGLWDLIDSQVVPAELAW